MLASPFNKVYKVQHVKSYCQSFACVRNVAYLFELTSKGRYILNICDRVANWTSFGTADLVENENKPNALINETFLNS